MAHYYYAYSLQPPCFSTASSWPPCSSAAPHTLLIYIPLIPRVLEESEAEEQRVESVTNREPQSEDSIKKLNLLENRKRTSVQVGLIIFISLVHKLSKLFLDSQEIAFK